MTRVHAILRSTVARITAALLFFASASLVQATDYFVDPSGADADDCLSMATPCRTIQGAIDKAADSGDTVHIASGVFVENLDIGKDVVLAGLGAGITTIDGSGAGTTLHRSEP